jgi:hypothetical protein
MISPPSTDYGHTQIIHLRAFSINGAVEDMERAEGEALGFGIIAQGTSIKRRMVRDDQDLRPLMLIFSCGPEDIDQGFSGQLPLSDRRRMFLEPPLFGLTPQENTVNLLHVLGD